MKIKEYIQYRYNLESININDLEKIDYKKENNDYKTLIGVAQTYSIERDYFRYYVALAQRFKMPKNRTL